MYVKKNLLLLVFSNHQPDVVDYRKICLVLLCDKCYCSKNTEYSYSKSNSFTKKTAFLPFGKNAVDFFVSAVFLQPLFAIRF